MSFSNENLRSPVMSEQIKSGITATSRTLRFFGVENPQVNAPGRIRLASDSKIMDIERAIFIRENGIFNVVEPESNDLKDTLFDPVKINTEDGVTILLNAGYFNNLVNRNGQNIKDREIVSNVEVMLFEMTAISQLGITAKAVDALESDGVKDRCLDDLRDFLISFAKENPQIDQVGLIPERYNAFIGDTNSEDLKLKVKGLRFSVSHQENDLFTINYETDQSMRFLIASRMFPKFLELMSQKYFWFSPSERMKTGLALEPKIAEELNEVFSVVDTSDDTRKLIKMYASGELGLKYLKLMFDKLKLEESTRKRNLAQELREKMLAGNGDTPDCSNYEM